jgi:hypothetical protein
MSRHKDSLNSVAVRDEVNRRVIAVSVAATALAALFTYRKVRAHSGARFEQLQENADQAVKGLSEDEKQRAFGLAEQITSSNVKHWGEE